MSEGNEAEDDCPLCLEPLPPFWDVDRRVSTSCCCKFICEDCHDKQNAYLDNAAASGSYGRQEEQLNNYCALCRAPNPTVDEDIGRMKIAMFEKGQLPLHMYCDLGLHFFLGDYGMERNVERGAEILKLGANKGDPNCQFVIGSKYLQGSDGLPKFPEEAKKWYLAAAEQGHAIAENNLACMMEEEGNYEGYLKYMRGSASKGYDVACYNLGIVYYHGLHGVQKSYEDAIRVLQTAAERGHLEAMHQLGSILCQPDPQLPPHLPIDMKGLHWLRRAAATGDQKAIGDVEELEEWASSFCFRCNKEAPPEKAFLRCSRCRAAWYCSKDCQRRHWKAKQGGHKKNCIKWESANGDGCLN